MKIVLIMKIQEIEIIIPALSIHLIMTIKRVLYSKAWISQKKIKVSIFNLKNIKFLKINKKYAGV